jgi:predicted SnoaL-like aldol condensation-catalyzing enzyme
MDNKEKAKKFLQMAGTGEVKTAYEQFVAHNFRHHNQYFQGDRESLLKAMEQAAQAQPNKTIETKSAYQDGNTVITHSLVKRAQPGQPDIAVVHIFKFEDGKITELWDLGQPIDPNSPNQNGMF